MNYYEEIKNKIIDEELYNKIKDYSKERYKVKTYYEIGKLLTLAGKEYGKNIIVNYGERLSIEIGKKYNYRTLYRMRKLYEIFSNEKLTPLVSKLTWTHYILLITLNNYDEIIYYINICTQNNLTKRELENKIKNNEYKRLPHEIKNKIVNNKEPTIKDLIPNPILIRNKNNIEVVNEKILHQLILEDIQSFMKELGTGYSFIESEYKIKIGNTYNYIDLLLYNIKYNCYVIIELKVTELKKEHIGQIQTYMNYIDKNLKEITQDKTIGIIITKKDNKFIMEYCSDERILNREYQII